ncbi:MBL fold metallo-hydrolase [Fredinandcohnia sp. 179-A 10B2 NHS]|uniref:MBL fold metallo-hydrolase n=1 Tax=Fredinandcohnia sp. 179-A 10B2 NHS TaxID=3235176 RepID=UPI0039A12C25
MNTLTQLNERIFLIDAHDLGRQARTGSYIIKEDKITIIETSASPSIPYILEGLKQLEIDPLDVEYVIVTHIHLDHAGGAGLLLDHCINAKLVVHPKGARHLADPSRLIAGARAVYGEAFDDLFNPIIPIAEQKILVKDDSERLEIGVNCTLVFYDTPGHANHHFSIYDPVSNGIFTGDTVGIYYHELTNENIDFFLPSTSPNQFNPEAMQDSIEKIKNLQISAIYFGHYGMSTNVDEVFKQLQYWLPIFVNVGKNIYEGYPAATVVEKKDKIKEELMTAISNHLDQFHIPRDHDVYEILHLDLDVCSMGIVDYLSKQY